MKKVIIRDIGMQKNHYLELSDEQYRLLCWLDGEDLLRVTEIELFKDDDFKEI